MDAGITTAATATGSAPGASPAGLFGALAGVKGHGPMSGFQALLAAFFGHQGDDAQAGLVGAGPTASQGKLAFALKSDSKAGHMAMDDALNTPSKDGALTDDKPLDGAAPDNVAANPALSADAQALAALFAAPLQKAPPVEETTGKPPAGQTAANAGEAGVPALAIGVATTEPPAIDAAAAGAEEVKANADQAAVSTGRAKLVEFAEALAATRHGARAAAAKADAAAQPGVRPPPAPTAAENAAKAAPADTPDLAQAAETAAASPVVQTEVAETELAAPAPTPPKDRGARAGRTDGVHKDSATPLLLTPTAVDSAAKPAVPAANPFAVQPGHTESAEDKPSEEPEIAPLKVEVAAEDASLAQAPAAASHAAPATAQAATAAVRGAPETVASLAAQIIKKAEGRATRFDVELHPADLGRVDVRLEIGAHGRLTASMSFENPHAAAELRGRADELQRALENAGFDLSGGLSFDVAGDRSQGRNQPEQQSSDGSALRGRAFEAALASAGETVNAALSGALNAYQSRIAPGLDIRI